MPHFFLPVFFGEIGIAVFNSGIFKISEMMVIDNRILRLIPILSTHRRANDYSPLHPLPRLFRFRIKHTTDVHQFQWHALPAKSKFWNVGANNHSPLPAIHHCPPFTIARHSPLPATHHCPPFALARIEQYAI